MRGRFGWIGAGVLLVGIVAVLALGAVTFAGADLLAGSDEDKAERAVEPKGAEKKPPEAAKKPDKKEEAQKEEPKKDEAEKKEASKEEPEKDEESKKDEPDEELSNKEQAEVADNFSAPEEASAAASASASASGAASGASASAAPAPADTTMTLEVPAIGLSVGVYEGTSEASLSAGTGHLSGTGYPWIPGSNTYIAGHRIGYPGTASDHVFWDLPSLAVGDEVYLTDANGTTYTYAVSEILEVPITDLSVTAPVGRDVVSLQTCIENYGDYWTPGPNWHVRYVVRADKVA